MSTTNTDSTYLASPCRVVLKCRQLCGRGHEYWLLWKPHQLVPSANGNEWQTDRTTLSWWLCVWILPTPVQSHRK